LTHYLDFDDHSITELLKVCTRSEDSILRRLGDGLLNRRLYKALDVTALVPSLELSRIVAFNVRVTERLREVELDPRYSFVEDSASDTPYEPYRPDAEKPSRQIYVESGSGRIVEITALSEALGQLSKTYTVIRYYVPAEFRGELARIAAEALARTRGEGRP